MASFKEIIENAKSLYINSIDKDELKKSIVNLNKIIKDPGINEENKANATNVLVLNTVKYAFVFYANNNFSHTSYEKNMDLLKGISSFANNSGVEELIKLVSNAITVSEKIDKYLKEIENIEYRLFDTNGILVETNVEIVEDTLDKLDKKIEEISNLGKLNILPQIKMIDMTEKLTLILYGIKNKVLKAQDEVVEKNYKKIISLRMKWI